MTERRVCPNCGTEFVPGPGLKNLCPRCLMQSVLADSGNGESLFGPPEGDQPVAAAESSGGQVLAAGATVRSSSVRPSAGSGRRSGDYRFRPGDRVLDGYTVVAPLGVGGFGEVYHARSDAGKDVAAKLVQRHLEVELRGVGHCLNLKHPNLVTTYDVRPDRDGQHWIVMEYVAGETLADELDRHPNGLPPDRVLFWLEGIVAGVEHLHEEGIVHRDLKPGNIFQERGTVKVGDYGLSKYITASRRSAQTQSVGTLHYMAPEIGGGRYGREVDVYAIGVMLYEMCTGRVPFDGETPAEILMKHLTAPPDLAPLPASLRGTVARMLAKHPDDRYGSLRGALADVKARLADHERTRSASDPEASEYAPAPWHAPGPSTWLEDQFKALLAPRPRKAALPETHGPAAASPDGRALVLLSLLLVLILLTATALLGVRLTIVPVAGGFAMAALLVGFRLTARQRDHAAREPFLSAPRAQAAGQHLPPASPPHAAASPANARPPHAGRTSGARSSSSGRRRLGLFGSVLISLFWGTGVALILGGVLLAMNPRQEEFAILASAGTGCFVAGVIAVRCLMSAGESFGLRLVGGLFLGASIGLTIGGLSHVAFSMEEESALLGIGVGLLTAGAFVMRFLSRGGRRRSVWGTAAFLAGVGAGFTTGAALCMNHFDDEWAALLSFGVGFLTTGILWFRIAAAESSHAALRVLTALLSGVGAGLLTGGLLLIPLREEAAAFLGTGVGFLTCGVTAYCLFAIRPAGEFPGQTDLST